VVGEQPMSKKFVQSPPGRGGRRKRVGPRCCKCEKNCVVKEGFVPDGKILTLNFEKNCLFICRPFIVVCGPPV